MSTLRIACTAINKRIMAGKVGKDGLSFTGNPIDVTSDCLKAVIEKIGIGQTHSVMVDGIPEFEIEVRAAVRSQS